MPTTSTEVDDARSSARTFALTADILTGVAAAAADPEREYVQVILPAKLQHAAEYAERASLATDLGVLWRTLRLLLRQV